MTTIFIFRRDYRIEDNPGFKQALEYSKQNKTLFQPIFIFSKEQSDPKINQYFSHSCFNFLCYALNDLQQNYLKTLQCFYQDQNDIQILKQIEDVKAIYENYDPTPYARQRQQMIKDYCQKHQQPIEYYNINQGGNHLYQLGNIVVDEKIQKPYTIFAPYYKRIQQLTKKELQEPQMLSQKDKKYLKDLKPIKMDKINKKNIVKPLDMINDNTKTNTKFTATRKQALTILKKIKDGEFKDYKKTRDLYQDDDGTTKLSPYHKFGLISFRETYYSAKNVGDIQMEIVWNQFNSELCHYKPEILQNQVSKKQNALFIEYKNLEWNNSQSDYNKIINGQTGYPLVDASVKQLIETNHVHNRLRMLFANFASKLAQVDWRKLEKFYAQNLIDYDPVQNNLGFAWNSIGGTDYQAMIRIFSPQQQIKRFDPQGCFIKKYFPQLNILNSKEIQSDPPIKNYIEPMFNYKEQREKSIKWLKNIERI